MNTDKVDEILNRLGQQAYKNRFRKEYELLNERIENLEAWLQKAEGMILSSEEEPIPMPYHMVLKLQQLDVMKQYRDILIKRSQEEDIPLTEEE